LSFKIITTVAIAMKIVPIIDNSALAPRLLIDLPAQADGWNRGSGETQMMTAGNDGAAVIEFLSYYSDSKQTLKSFSRETERFLQWLWHVRCASLSTVKQTCISEYLDFIGKPEPVTTWCGARTRRFKPDGSLNERWKPFTPNANGEYGLSGAAAQLAEKVLAALFNHLVQGGYLNASPIMTHKRRKAKTLSAPKLERFLYKDEVQFVLYTIKRASEALDPADQSGQFRLAREDFIVRTLFFTGLRITELTEHSMSDITGSRGSYAINVVGKGGKPRSIDLSKQYAESLSRYRRLSGYDTGYPTVKEKSFPLIAAESRKKNESLVKNKRISNVRVHQILKDVFGRAADAWIEEAKLEAGELKHEMIAEAEKMRQASAHWLRHSKATYMLEAGATIKEAMEQMGHSDPGTLMIYQHVLSARRSELANRVILEEI